MLVIKQIKDAPDYYITSEGEVWSAKTDNILIIRQRYKVENVSQAQLGREYNVSKRTINRVVRRLAWKHVT